jgi:hypothetical protein
VTKGSEQPVASRQVIRFGNARVATAVVITLGCALAAMAVTLMLTAALGTRVPAGFRVMFAVLAVATAAGLAGLVVVLVRNPRTLRRTIVVDSTGVLMPARRSGLVPLDEVAGVGLVRIRNPKNGRPAGSWGVALWRADGSVAFAGGFQSRADVRDPRPTAVAVAAEQLHDAVTRLQGRNGLLAQRELQRHARFAPGSQFTGAWDPSGG